MPTEGTDFHGIYEVKAFSSHHPSCVFRAFRGPLFRNFG
jgi:hypothetical protein